MNYLWYIYWKLIAFQCYCTAVKPGKCLALTNIKLMLPGITVLWKFLMPVGVKVPNHFYLSAILCLCHCLLIKENFVYKKKQPPVAILFWVPCAKYIIIMTYRNWHPLIQYPVNLSNMLATPTLKWPFGDISPHLLCNFYL